MPLRHQKASNMNLMSILLSTVIVSASSAAVALAFDAGGNQRQEDIWVADGRPPKCPPGGRPHREGGKGLLVLAWARQF